MNVVIDMEMEHQIEQSGTSCSAEEDNMERRIKNLRSGDPALTAKQTASASELFVYDSSMLVRQVINPKSEQTIAPVS